MNTQFFHVTAKNNLNDILTNGLSAGTYFTNNEELTDYYAETIEDEGDTPITLCVDAPFLLEQYINPDFNGLYEPIMTVVRELNDKPRYYSEEDLLSEWKATDQSWQSCLELIGSIQYDSTISAKHVFVLQGDDVLSLEEFLKPSSNVSTKKKSLTP